MSQKDLDSLNRKELRSLAKAQGIPRYGKLGTGQIKRALLDLEAPLEQLKVEGQIFCPHQNMRPIGWDSPQDVTLMVRRAPAVGTPVVVEDLDDWEGLGDRKRPQRNPDDPAHINRLIKQVNVKPVGTPKISNAAVTAELERDAVVGCEDCAETQHPPAVGCGSQLCQVCDKDLVGDTPFEAASPSPLEIPENFQWFASSDFPGLHTLMETPVVAPVAPQVCLNKEIKPGSTVRIASGEIGVVTRVIPHKLFGQEAQIAFYGWVYPGDSTLSHPYYLNYLVSSLQEISEKEWRDATLPHTHEDHCVDPDNPGEVQDCCCGYEASRDFHRPVE